MRPYAKCVLRNTDSPAKNSSRLAPILSQSSRDVRRWRWMVAPTIGTEVGHGNEPGAVPGGSVDGGVHGEVRDGSEVPRRGLTCRRAVLRSRWPKGFRCPACARRGHSRFRREGQIYYQCSTCRHQTTLLSGANQETR